MGPTLVMGSGNAQSMKLRIVSTSGPSQTGKRSLQCVHLAKEQRTGVHTHGTDNKLTQKSKGTDNKLTHTRASIRKDSENTGKGSEQQFTAEQSQWTVYGQMLSS